MAQHTFANKLYAHISASITAAQETIPIVQEEMSAILQGFVTSKWLYLTLVDGNGNLEIVKVTAISGSTLTVERGQGGSTARAFPKNSPISQRLIAEYFTQFLQKGASRTGAYNPNGALIGAYNGEKFWQTGPADDQKRWWMNTGGGSQWRLLSGALYGNEYEDDEGYILTPDVIYPDEDISNVDWQAFGGPTDLYACVNDTIAALDDTTYIRNNYYAAAMVLGLEAVAYLPGDSWIEAEIRLRACDEWGTCTIGVSLYSGDDLIGAEVTIGPAGDLGWDEVDPQTFKTFIWSWYYEFTTEVSDLRVKIERLDGGMGSLYPRISEIEVELY